MGIDVSASFAVVTIATFLVIGAMYPAVSNSFDRITGAELAELADEQDVLRTDMEIETARWDSDASELFVNVTNTGQTPLAVNATDFLVNGTYVTSDNISEVAVENDGNTRVWAPGESLEVTLSVEAADRITVVTEHGIAEGTADIDKA